MWCTTNTSTWSVRRDAQQPRPNSGALGQVEGLAGESLRPRVAARPNAPSAPAPQFDHAAVRTSSCAQHALHRHRRRRRRSAVRRASCAVDERLQRRCAARRRRARPLKPGRRGDVVERRSRRLSWSRNHRRCCAERQRARVPASAALPATSGQSAVAALRSRAAPDSLRQLGNGRRLEQRAQRQFDAEHGAQRATSPGWRSSEWPPSSKKSSCTPTRSRPSTSAQMAASASSSGRARGDEGGGGRWRRRRGGQRLAVELAVGRCSGSAASAHEGGGHHVVGQARLERGAQRGGVDARSPTT